MPAQNVTVVPPGVDPMYQPGGARSPHPLVVAVGRLVPVKRPGELVAALLETKKSVPALEAVIVGEGYERDALEAQIRAAGAQDWLRLPGRVSDAELVELYRRAWVLTSASAREGWGMTLTEAAACGTPRSSPTSPATATPPSRASRGLLVPQPADLAPALTPVLHRPCERARCAGALGTPRASPGTPPRATFSVLAERRRAPVAPSAVACGGPDAGRADRAPDARPPLQPPAARWAAACLSLAGGAPRR